MADIGANLPAGNSNVNPPIGGRNCLTKTRDSYLSKLLRIAITMTAETYIKKLMSWQSAIIWKMNVIRLTLVSTEFISSLHIFRFHLSWTSVIIQHYLHSYYAIAILLSLIIDVKLKQRLSLMGNHDWICRQIVWSNRNVKSFLSRRFHTIMHVWV